MNTVDAAKKFFEEKLEELEMLSSLERIEYLVEIGSSYLQDHPFDESLMIQDNRVPGCVSGAYLVLEISDNTVIFSGMAEAKTVNGFMAIVLEAFNGLSVNDFTKSSETLVLDFAKRSSIAQTLTPNRANALGNIYSLMRKLVLSYSS